MRPQGIPARMRDPLPRAVAPLAAVLLLPRANMIFVQMFDQVIHVVQVAGLAPLPLADCDLLLPVVVVGGHARVVRRGGDRAIRVFTDLAEILDGGSWGCGTRRQTGPLGGSL